MPRQSNFARAMRQQCMSLILLMALGSAGFAHADDESADPTHLRQQAANTAPLIESLFHEGLRRVSVPKEELRSGAAPEDVQHRLFSASNAQLCVSIYAAFEPRPDRAYLFLSRSYAYSWNEQKGSEVPINGYRAYWQELDKTAGPGGTFRWEGNLWVTTLSRRWRHISSGRWRSSGCCRPEGRNPKTCGCRLRAASSGACWLRRIRRTYLVGNEPKERASAGPRPNG